MIEIIISENDDNDGRSLTPVVFRLVMPISLIKAWVLLFRGVGSYRLADKEKPDLATPACSDCSGYANEVDL